MNPTARYFSPDYFTARDRFRQAVTGAGGRLEILQIDAKGPGGEELSTDIAWFGSDKPHRLLLHSSGLHGVEGFAGSAIQLRLLDRPPSPPMDTAIVLVHILNPYGMAWLRRVNEHNVDLNRNFQSAESYEGAPPTYAALDAFLNPPTPPAADMYFAKAAFLILRHGMTALKRSIVGGQYEFPKGLFFGGKRLEEGPRRYEEFVRQRLSAAEQSIVIDVHTGLGKFGEDSLLVEFADYDRLRSRFGERVTALQPGEGPGYHVAGGLESMIFRVFSEKHPMFLCQEFGTYNPAKVLHALREENRWHHYGMKTIDHATKHKLKETFYPASESWREAVLKRGQDLLEHAIAELANDR